MKTRCVNLREQEAIAAAQGKLTTIVRPVGASIAAPGDILIGREAWGIDPFTGKIMYRYGWKTIDPDFPVKWKSPATMPAKYARHRFKVVEVEVVSRALLARKTKQANMSILKWLESFEIKTENYWFVKIEREAE